MRNIMFVVILLVALGCEDADNDVDTDAGVDPCELVCTVPDPPISFECIYPQGNPCGDGGECDGDGNCVE